MKRPSRIFVKYFLRQLLISAVPILLLGTLAIHLIYFEIRQTTYNSVFHSLEQSKNFISQVFAGGNTIGSTFNPDAFSGFSLKHILEKKELNYKNAVKYPIFSSILNTFVNTNSYFESVYLYWPNDYGNLLVSNRGIIRLDYMEDTGWLADYEAFMNDPSCTFTIHPRSYTAPGKIPSPIITVYQKIITLDYPVSKGSVIINIKPSAIEKQLHYQCSFSEQQIYLFSNNGTLIASSGGAEFNKERQDQIQLISTALLQMPHKQMNFHQTKKEYTISILKDENTSLFYVSIIPNHQLYAIPAKLLSITGFLIILSCLVSLILATAYSKRISKNIHTIMDIFHAAQNGQPLPAVPADSNDEQSTIITNLISTFVRQEYLTIQLSEKNYRAKTLELVALQSQINPHFLFNTLETIRLKSFQLTGGFNDVSALIENLADIMRYTLSDPHEQVSLKDEITYSKAYLNIQKFRYKDKFHVIWEYDPDILSIRVIKLLIQPLLENSIRHGIAPSERECLIKIKIYQKQNLLHLHIIDTGIGMTKQQHNYLLTHILNEDTAYQHIGLSNTWKRLRLIYGEQAVIRIQSKYLYGTAITFILPIRP